MIKICFFIETLRGGGAEHALVNLANRLDKTKFDVVILTLFDVGCYQKAIHSDVRYKYVFKKPFKAYQRILKLFSPRLLYRLMIKDDYDIVVSYLQGSLNRIVASCTKPNVKIVQWMHRTFQTRDYVLWMYRNNKEYERLQSSFDATIFVSRAAMEANLKIHPEWRTNNNVVLYNVQESELIKKLGNELIDNERFSNDGFDFSLISVGRLVEDKGFDRLLRVVERLIRQDKLNVKLYILGQGELELNLKRQVAELNIEKSICFLGFQENPYKYMKNADLFVCASRYEGYGLVVAESLLVGTPVVVTDFNGAREITNDGEFGVVTENNEEALYQGVRSLLLSKEKLAFYKEKAKRGGERFDTQKTVRETEEALEKLFGQPSCARAKAALYVEQKTR